jgi:ferric-dicitrate binding protein FerR (iron transport regulator)
MPEPLDWQLIDRYLAGEASPAEVADVQARSQADPAWAKALDMLRSDFATGTPRQWDANLAWTRVRPRLTTDPGIPATRSPRRAVTPLRDTTTRWRIAASLIVFAGSLATWQVTSRLRRPTPNAPTSAMATEIVTPNGARNTVLLGDGSRVTLNAGSRLRLAPDFGAGSRDVYLEGEAYFVVTHDAARPFRVHARDAVAHDLGTRFVVRAYAELARIEVIVAEGAVSLRHDRTPADSAILSTGQLGRLDAAGPPTVETNVPLERWIAWTGGSLVLEGLTLAEAIPQLERWYDATITVSDPRLAERRISARFHDETLPQMLDALTLALGARWQQSGRSITLAPITR